MTPLRRAPLLAAAVCAVALFGAACSVKASIGGDDTTTTAATTTKATTTTAPGSDGTTDTNTGTPAVGTTEQVGAYTLTIVDPKEAGLATPQGVTEVTAASITKSGDPIGLLVKYTVDGTVTDENIRQILQTAGEGAAVSPVTINGKQAYDVTLASGQVVVARATETGDIGLVVGVPGVTKDQLEQAVADVTS
ncbi:MAG: hypothetical protein U0U69_12165 [Acidimicrobiia bacterium]